MKKIIKKLPIIRDLAKFVYFSTNALFSSFPGSENYWKTRYRLGGNSGDGSYNELAEFKARVINNFVKEKNIQNVIEYGCGDGNQLRLSDYKNYTGFDVSPVAIQLCKNIFSSDSIKKFKLIEEYKGEKAELTLSLDVIFHLIEDDIFESYMERLFASSTRYVIIFSSNTSEQFRFQAPHVKHRKFSTWVQQHKPDWTLERHIPNQYPYQGDDEKGSFADFYIYSRP